MNHAPYRNFARLAQRQPPPAPEPLTRRERQALTPAALAERRDAEINYVSGLLVLTDRQQECMREVHRQVRLMPAANPGAQESLYVIGPTGTGKSTAVLRAAIEVHNQVLKDFGQEGLVDPVVDDPGWQHALIPVIWVNVRADAGGKSVNGHILSALMQQEPSGVAWELANRITKILPWHRTRLIVLDDTHNLGTGGAETERILQTVKNLQTDLGMQNTCFIYIGNPDRTGEYNLTLHEQLRQRLVPFNVEPFDFDLHASDDPAPNLAWAAYLYEWETALMPVLPDLRHGDIASRLGRRLWNRTHGSPGALIGLLKRHVQRVLEEEHANKLTVVRDDLLNEPVPMKYLRPMVSSR